MDRRAYIREWLRDRHARLRAEALERLGGQCVECGSTEGLELDHIDRATKTREMGHMARMSRAAFEAELAKCQILCHDHHVAKTIAEVGHTTGHGTEAEYKHRGCRCEPCRLAHSAYGKAQRQRTGYSGTVARQRASRKEASNLGLVEQR